MFPTLAPMLATAGPLPTADAWVFEPKLDGWRVLVYVDCDVDVRTRTGRSIAASLPELALLPEALAARRVVFDGELVAGQGRPQDFYQLAPRLTAQRPAAVARGHRSVPLTFVAFDLLWVDGEDFTREPYDVRRRELESLRFSGRSWCTAASYEDGAELLRACVDLDLEGVVAKRRTSRYRPGVRTRDWVKVKTPAWLAHHAPRRHDDRRRSAV